MRECESVSSCGETILFQTSVGLETGGVGDEVLVGFELDLAGVDFFGRATAGGKNSEGLSFRTVGFEVGLRTRLASCAAT